MGCALIMKHFHAFACVCFSSTSLMSFHFNPLKTKSRLLSLKIQSVPRVNTFHLGYKNQ